MSLDKPAGNRPNVYATDRRERREQRELGGGERLITYVISSATNAAVPIPAQVFKEYRGRHGIEVLIGNRQQPVAGVRDPCSKPKMSSARNSVSRCIRTPPYRAPRMVANRPKVLFTIPTSPASNPTPRIRKVVVRLMANASPFIKDDEQQNQPRCCGRKNRAAVRLPPARAIWGPG